MRLDRDTIMWVIDNLTDYDHEYDRGPRYQEMTFRKGGEDHDFKYFFAGDIREWLAGELHGGALEFLPETAADNQHSKAEDIKRLEARCDCGWVDGFDIDHINKTYDVDERALNARHSKHVADEVKKIMERFKWED